MVFIGKSLEIFRRLLPTETVEARYVAAAQSFIGFITSPQIEGDMSIGYYLDRWEAWEKEYSRRGFKTLSLEEVFDGMLNKQMLNKYLGEPERKGLERLHASFFRRDTYKAIQEHGTDVRSLLHGYLRRDQIEDALEGQDRSQWYRSDDLADFTGREALNELAVPANAEKGLEGVVNGEE